MQLATTFDKSFKSLFLGIADMDLVNTHIIYWRLWEKKPQKSSPFRFLAKLHCDLIEVKVEIASPSPG